jgi:hypothetical protein
LFPYSKKFYGIPVSNPIPDDFIASFWILVLGNIGDADVIFLILNIEGDLFITYIPANS